MGTPRATKPKPTINPLLPAAVATEIISPATPEPQTEPTPRNSFDDFNFDPQRFGTYEDQVNSHGGSGNIKPDQVINARKMPKTAEPLSIIDHVGKDGKIDKRSFYDEEGKIYLPKVYILYDDVETVTTWDKLMVTPFIDGKTLAECATEIEFYG